MEERIKEFQARLISWGKKYLQSYPWRFEQDPYRVLVSEFMLHRTQTRQVLPVYVKFIERYPTLSDYAASNEEEAKSQLYSLGLNWRITGMLKALNQLWKEYKEIPLDTDRLIAIEGIGQYIAGATICFSRNLPMVIIDSNIVRVIGRIHGIDLNGEVRRKKIMIEAIENSLDFENPRDFYYSIIDLAHEICHPKNPDCHSCPFIDEICRYVNSSNPFEGKME